MSRRVSRARSNSISRLFSSRELYRATREGLFALAQENVARFWPMVGRFQRLLSLHAVIEQVVRFDKLFYEVSSRPRRARAAWVVRAAAHK